MDSKLIFGVCVSIVFLFVRYRWPVVPKPFATFGICMGLGLAVWSFTMVPVGLAVSLILNVALVAAIGDHLIHRRTLSRTAGTPENRERQRQLIDRARSFAANYTKGGVDGTFRGYLEGTPTYAALRGHLSKQFFNELNQPRRVTLPAEGARYDPIVEAFLNELDRLEREWGIN